jgi:hypothetical protein
MADTGEASSTASRSWVPCIASANVSMPINRLMVKPMPPSMPTPRICHQLAPRFRRQCAGNREPSGPENAERFADDEASQNAER